MNGKHLCLTDMNSSCLTGTNSQSLSVRRTMDMQEYNSPVYGLRGLFLYSGTISITPNSAIHAVLKGIAQSEMPELTIKVVLSRTSNP